MARLNAVKFGTLVLGRMRMTSAFRLVARDRGHVRVLDQPYRHCRRSLTVRFGFLVLLPVAVSDHLDRNLRF